MLRYYQGQAACLQNLKIRWDNILTIGLNVRNRQAVSLIYSKKFKKREKQRQIILEVKFLERFAR